MTAATEFRAGPYRTDLIHLTGTTGRTAPHNRDADTTPGGDGFWWRVRSHGAHHIRDCRTLAELDKTGAAAPMPDMVTAALAHPFITLPALTALGVPMNDRTLAAAILDDPAVAAKLGVTSMTEDSSDGRLAA